jgi:hypothetical protein
MNFDLRLPVGLMFTVFGAILILVGLGVFGTVDLAKTLSINMNLWWGLVMLVFGLAMLIMSQKGKKP